MINNKKINNEGSENLFCPGRNLGAKSKKLHKAAFTLAEVMITSGIIGVIAMITLPMLINNANSRKFASQYKKSLATLAQASLISQARYDIDYSLISEDSVGETCRTVALSKGDNSMCALFNNAFTAKSYRGVYGSVGGILPGTHYKVKTFSDGFNPANYLIYTLSDGAMVGFNPSAKGCSLTPGTQLTNEMITGEGALANCLGFIDVNGVSLPNREVACDTSSETALTPNASCKVEKANGDVFPIVFHNGTVEPITNAARAAMGFLGPKESSASKYSSFTECFRNCDIHDSGTRRPYCQDICDAAYPFNANSYASYSECYNGCKEHDKLSSSYCQNTCDAAYPFNANSYTSHNECYNGCTNHHESSSYCKDTCDAAFPFDENSYRDYNACYNGCTNHHESSSYCQDTCGPAFPFEASSYSDYTECFDECYYRGNQRPYCQDTCGPAFPFNASSYSDYSECLYICENHGKSTSYCQDTCGPAFPFEASAYSSY